MSSSERVVSADVIVTAARIYTMNERAPHAEAVAIRGGRFVAVGSPASVAPYRGRETRVLDLGNATIVPGLQDAHGHVLGLGESLETLDLTGTVSLHDVVARVKARVSGAPAGTWIIGRGWDQNDWPTHEWPTAAGLDGVSGDHPVWLTRIDGHAAVANTRAIRIAGVTGATVDPPGGRIIRTREGAPAGVFVDAAQALVSSHIPQPTAAQVAARLVAADRELSRVGLTMVHDAGVDPADIEIYRRAVARGDVHTRLYVMVAGERADAWFERGPLVDPEQRLTVRAVKLYADGALGSRGAALLEPYADEPGNSGLLVTPPDVLRTRARAAVEAGFQVAIHAIGDRANREVLDLYEALERERPGARALRLRVEHAQILDAHDIPRFAALGVIASMQATHCTSDMPWAPSRLGNARIDEGAYAWQSLLKTGAHLANGSDFPVERPDPLLGFYAAVTRQGVDGAPTAGWNPEQRLTREEALRSFTLGAAYAAHAESELGSIEVGKRADLVALSRDIMTVPASEIPSTQVLHTMIDGRTVYQAEP